MSKGVIVQLEQNTAHILKNNGIFVSYPRNPLWQIGEVVTLPRRRFPLTAVLISCAVLLSAFAGTGIALYNIPSAYIEISVNPSVQLTLNRFDHVLDVSGLNTDGELFLQGNVYKDLSLYEAYSRLFNRMENEGKLKNASVQLVIANNAQRAMDGIEQKLRDASKKYMENNNLKISIKRYTREEYLLLAHPLPMMEIPEYAPQDEQPLSESSEQPTPTPEPTVTPEPNEQPTPEPSVEPVPTPSAEPAPQPEVTPSMPSSGMGHHGGWRHGWYDWDCN